VLAVTGQLLDRLVTQKMHIRQTLQLLEQGLLAAHVADRPDQHERPLGTARRQSNQQRQIELHFDHADIAHAGTRNVRKVCGLGLQGGERGAAHPVGNTNAVLIDGTLLLGEFLRMNDYQIRSANQRDLTRIVRAIDRREAVLVVDVIADEIRVDRIERPIILWAPDIQHDPGASAPPQCLDRVAHALPPQPIADEPRPVHFGPPAAGTIHRELRTACTNFLDRLTGMKTSQPVVSPAAGRLDPNYVELLREPVQHVVAYGPDAEPPVGDERNDANRTVGSRLGGTHALLCSTLRTAADLESSRASAMRPTYSYVEAL